MRSTGKVAALSCALVLGVLAIPAVASPVSLIVETAYLFAQPHGLGPPDGGSVYIKNTGSADVTIQHVILSGWSNNTTFDFGPANLSLCVSCEVGTGPNGPITPGLSLLTANGGDSVYNEAGPNYPADTSNFGTLSNPPRGILIEIQGMSQGSPFDKFFADNPNYALTGGVNTGVDVEGPTGTGVPYGRVSVPEPGALGLLASSLGMVFVGRVFRSRMHG